jgi:hypothetical protein
LTSSTTLGDNTHIQALHGKQQIPSVNANQTPAICSSSTLLHCRQY